VFHYSYIVDASWFFRAGVAWQKVIWETVLIAFVVLTNFETHVTCGMH